MSITQDSVPDVNEALNEYFKMKQKYETLISANKKRIINNITLSKKEKRAEYIKLKPKCINCSRPGGTIFKATYFPDSDSNESYRQFSATCGIIADPCNLNIQIQLGKIDLLPNLLNSIQKEMADTKNEIINNKNKLLFGYLTAENVLEKFETLKNNISFYSSLYEAYLERYNELVDNDEKKMELNEKLMDSYIEISKIKECVKKMNDTDNSKYILDAINIYDKTLMPLLTAIRHLKYNENMVWYDENSKTFHLIQNSYNISKLSYTSHENKVASYDVGLSIEKPQKKGNLVIESSTTSMSESMHGSMSESMPSKEGDKEILVLEQDEPIYGKGKDGISWNIQQYNDLWNRMPAKLRTALKSNETWMKEFMVSCVNLRNASKPCIFITPSELKIPPEKLENDKYDFGISIYNEVFGKLNKSIQDTYLDLDDKKLTDTLNSFVIKALDFYRGFI